MERVSFKSGCVVQVTKAFKRRMVLSGGLIIMALNNFLLLLMG